MIYCFLLVLAVGVIADPVYECGKEVVEDELILGGKSPKGQVPWHAVIYTKTTAPYSQICGGSLISNNIVLAGATCFWTEVEEQQPASQFAVAVGKVYRPWADKHDDAQKSDVKEIHIPLRFLGARGNFQEDIAVVIVSNAFVYNSRVIPVCLNFDTNSDQVQLTQGTKGKIAAWGGMSPILKVMDIPFVDIANCLKESPTDFRSYITSDKFCAKVEPPNILCRGDSGNGLSFPKMEKGVDRYYLRGIVSVAPAPSDGEFCNNRTTIIGFTHVTKHEAFIKQFWTES